MAEFTSEKFAPIYLHFIQYMGDCDDEECEKCIQGLKILRFGTGKMIKALILYKDRYTAGSDVCGINLGCMTPADSLRIQNDPTSDISEGALIKEIQESFPGMDFFHDVRGGDLMKRCDQYAPYLKHADRLYGTLRFMYNYVIGNEEEGSLPPFLFYQYFTICCFFSNITVLNPNSIWALPTAYINKDVINLLVNHLE